MEKKTRDLYDVIGAMAVYAALIFAITYLAFFANGCGGGNENGNPPVYLDNGKCVANCVVDGPDAVGHDTDNNKDNLPGDFSLDRADSPPQPDYGPAYVCPDPENPPEMCMPKILKEAFCMPTEPRICRYQIPYFQEGQPCTTDAECQHIPNHDELIKLTQEAKCEETPGWGEVCNQGLNYTAECNFYWDGNEKCRIIPQEVLDNPYYPYPPCVCWDVCGIDGEWKCKYTFDDGGIIYNFSSYKLEWFRDGGSVCLFDGTFSYKIIPGTKTFTTTATGGGTKKMTLTDNDTQLLQEYKNGQTWTCSRYIEP